MDSGKSSSDEGMLWGVLCALLAISPITLPIIYQVSYNFFRSLM